MTTEEKLLKTYEKELNDFQKLILENPRVPKNLNKILLLRFLKVYNFEMEPAKNLLSLFLETRKNLPQLYQNRDIMSDEFQAAMEAFYVIGLRKTTKENHKVTVFYLTSTDSSKFYYPNIARMLVTMLDCRFTYCDPNDLINGEISICDVSNFTFRHFYKVISELSIMKQYLWYTQEVAPLRIIQSHFVNCSPLLEKTMSMLKPFVRKEVWDAIKFHTSLESLHDYIPKEILPIEFGGTEGTIKDLFKEVKTYFESVRESLECDDNWMLQD